jgi:hypothetical protein
MAIKDRIAERMLFQSILNDFWDRIKKADSKRWVPPKINIEKFMKKYNPVDRTVALKPDGYRGKIKL